MERIRRAGLDDRVPSVVKAEDSLRKRYAYKLGVNFLALPFTLGTQAIVTRLLGPATYGSYSFLSSFFTQFVNFFDSGISAGLYSKLSQRPDEAGLVRFFWGVMAVISALVLMLIAVAFGVGWRETVWPGQRGTYVWMAAAWGLVAWYSLVMNKALDAYGLTVDSEVVRFKQKAFAFALVLIMAWCQWGSLVHFFIYQYAILLFLCLSWSTVLHHHGRRLMPAVRLNVGEIAGYRSEFYAYASPLVVVNLVALVAGILDRWFLQKFSGSIQQGYFGLSFQIGALCFMVSGAMTPLFWREIAKAYFALDHDAMRRLFGRTVKMLYVVTAFLSVFIAFQAKNMSLLLGGAQFSQAALPVAIMAFYPIHQTYGQLTGSFLLGTGQTQLTRNVGIVTTLLGLILSFCLLAPIGNGGLGLGATGLASKMVLAQLAEVNLQLWFVARFLRVSFLGFVVHQLCALAGIVLLAWLATWITAQLVSAPALALVSSGAIYTVSVGGLLFLFPPLIAMSHAELRTQIRAAQATLWGLRG